MTAAPAPDLSACNLWRPSIAFGGAHIGIIPAWNAVALLNPAAALIWDLLCKTCDADATATAYATECPERARQASADVTACISAWDAQGLFRAPAPSEETLLLQDIGAEPGRAGADVALRRVISVGDIPTLLEVEDPELANVVDGLLIDFSDTDAVPHRHLRASRPNGGWLLSIDGVPTRAAPNLVLARGQIVAELVRVAAGETGWRAIVHGAVLSGASGAIFLAGASGAGKSTLSAGLVARGWRILAEDLAAFGPGWTVCPLPFALSIKEGAVDALRAAYPDLAGATVHELGPRRIRYQSVPAPQRATEPERPRMIFEVCYSPDMGKAPATYERLTAIDALALFMNEESFIDFEREDSMGFLDLVEHTPAYRIRYGSTDMAAQCIADLMRSHPAGAVN